MKDSTHSALRQTWLLDWTTGLNKCWNAVLYAWERSFPKAVNARTLYGLISFLFGKQPYHLENRFRPLLATYPLGTL